MHPLSPRRIARLVHAAFEASLLLKAVEAGTELLAGLALWLTPGPAIHRLVTWLSSIVPTDDPQGLALAVAHDLLRWLTPGQQAFYALYLGLHGVVKLALVYGLFRKWLWAYPAAIAVFALFILYQLHRYALTGSVMMILLSVLDLVVIWLTWREFQRLRGVRAIPM